MTKAERRTILEILDKEWEHLSQLDLNQRPSLIQYAAAIWFLLENLPNV